MSVLGVVRYPVQKKVCAAVTVATLGLCVAAGVQAQTSAPPTVPGANAGGASQQLALPAGAYRSVGVAAAVLYDAPSSRARKLFVAPRGMPLEVLSTVNQWVKVRDQSGDTAWIERADLSTARTVVTTVLANVRTQPSDVAPLAFQVERAMALEWLDPAEAPVWLRVRARDGTQGFVRASEVWGF